MARSFSVTTRTAARREDLFDASLSIDAHVESMRHSGERAVAGVTTGTIGLGEDVTWRARHFGIRFTMTNRITALDRPRRFVDEQVRGPFGSFRHEHVFRVEGSQTVMIDTLTVAAPFLGGIVDRFVLVPYLRRLILRRNAHLVAAVAPTPPTHTHPALVRWPDVSHPGFRRFEASAVIGHGDRDWQRAAEDVLRWAVKTRSGFDVESPAPVSVGDRPTIRARVLGVTISEPVEVVDVVRQPTRVGFAYRTLPGHPVLGEESFVVSRADTSDGADIRLTVRSLTAPAPHQPWRMLHPALRVAQVIARRRYLRSLV